MTLEEQRSNAHKPHFIMVQKFVPIGPSKSVMAYGIYWNRNSYDANFKLISKMYAHVMTEDKTLCNT